MSGILVLVILRLLKNLKIILDEIICMFDAVSIDTVKKNNKMDYYIFHTILLVSICFLFDHIININDFDLDNILLKEKANENV